MDTLLPVRERVCETSDKWIASRPITFAEYLQMCGPKEYMELIDGVIVEKPMVQLDHEWLLMWLVRLLGDYAEELNLGVVFGSRTAVQISAYRARLPDLLFVRRDRQHILQQKALTAPPDLIIGVVSPGDRPSDLIALELDYTSIGVEEIVFIDQKKRRVRALRKQGESYVEEVITEGTLRLQTLPVVALETEWLFSEPRPAVRETLARFLGSQS